MEFIKNILIKSGQVDRRIIYVLISIFVLVPLIKPEWIAIPIKTSSHTKVVFDELDKMKGDLKDSSKSDKVLISFAYGASTKPEIHPMAVAMLQHLFSNGAKVYIVSLWPDGVIMSTEAVNEVISSRIFDVQEHLDYVNLGYKPGAQVVIRGIATDIRSLYTQDINKTLLRDIPMMEDVYSISDFDFVIDLSAGVPGNAEWVQYACDPYNIPLTSGCTSIMVTDAMPYVNSGQLKGILAGMPGAAEYENLVIASLKNPDIETQQWLNENANIKSGNASSMMSAQSLAHIFMVILIVFGNISYKLTRGRKR